LGGRWNKLGVFSFETGGNGYIELSGENKKVSADAVRLVKIEPPPPVQQGFNTISDLAWDGTAVRKVLHAFAYGGQAADEQIQMWVEMPPESAVEEMLTFSPHNDKLSPPEDSTRNTDGTLEGLQTFWSSNSIENPVRPDRRDGFDPLVLSSSNRLTMSLVALQKTWIQAATTRGLNPFRQKVGLFLTNYLMSLPVGDVRMALLRSYYDEIMTALEQGESLSTVQALAAKSGAIALHYGHQNNTYNNNLDIFSGNDDFAREFHQLFFDIQGELEDVDYHENTTVEHTAWLLTGMQLDRQVFLNGSQTSIDWFLLDIQFTDHTNFGQDFNNFSSHYAGCLEILHQPICGETAGEKITNLASVAINNQESLDNLPVKIVRHFGDDNLNVQKTERIREFWRLMVPKSLLDFLRAYAISESFHSIDRIKYRSAFDRNLVIQNLNTLSNQGYFAIGSTPRSQMSFEGADVFEPVHGVFGAQTGHEASVNTSILREAYQRNVERYYDLGLIKKLGYTDPSGNPADWYRDWAGVIPTDGDGNYNVANVGLWLWERFIGDGGKNYDALAQAHVESLLSTGMDLNTASSEDISPLLLDSAVSQEREEANRRVGLTVNFISMLPYMFVAEGK